jgi:hypothetical protein
MKKGLAAFGIILIFLSAFLIIASNINYGGTYYEWESDSSVVELGNSWNISRILNEEEWFRLEIVTPQDWNDQLQPSEPNIPYPYKPVFINITSPDGQESEIYCDFILVNTQAPLVLYNITVTETHGITGVHFEPPLYGSKSGVVAKTLLAGNYTARVVAVLGGGGPPFTLRLRTGALVTEKVSYFYLLYPGIALFIGSVALTIYGFRKRK